MGNDQRPNSSEKLREFNKRLRRAQDAIQEKEAPKPQQQTAMGVAFRIATELVVAVAVGVGMGWGLDSWLGTKPIFLLIFFLLGAAAGVMNVIRISKPDGSTNNSGPDPQGPRVGR